MINFGDGLLKGTVIDVVEEGNRLIQFSYEGIFEEILDQLGQMPLPPYITHRLQDKNRYQTVYAEHEGSAAAPTAGLHFTKELLAQIQEMGVKIAHVTLHVGLGTFRPVKVSNVLDHHMHSEFYRIEEDAANMINETKKNGGRIICVGTTSCRTIESAAAEDGTIRACSGWTDIFIYPGYQFKILDCLITNFHLPESTCWYPHWQAENTCSRRMKRRSGRDTGSLVLGMRCLFSKQDMCLRKTHSERAMGLFIS